MKKPGEFAISALRALDLETDAPPALLARIGLLGEPLYLCEPPTGYPDRAEKWSGANAILARVNFATALASGRVGGHRPDYGKLLAGATVREPRALAEWLCRQCLGRPLSPASEEPYLQAADAVAERMREGMKPAEAAAALAALVLGSPDFQMR